MKKTLGAGAIVVLVRLTTQHPVEAQTVQFDSCDTVLLGGVFQEEKITSAKDVHEAASDWMCLNEKNKASAGSGWGLSLGVPIDGVPLQIGANSNNTNSSAWSKDHCTDARRNNTLKDVYEHTTKVASPEILKAWTECKVQPHAGLTCSLANSTGPSVIFNYRWTPTDIEHDTIATVKGLTLTNATCDTIPAAGGKITAADATVCKRINKDEQAIVLLRTSKGPCSQVIPPVPPPPPPTPQEICRGGRVGAAPSCAAYYQALDQTCGPDTACKGKAYCYRNRGFRIADRDTVCAGAGATNPTCQQWTADIETGIVSVATCDAAAPIQGSGHPF
jgi:hypothetical protein